MITIKNTGNEYSWQGMLIVSILMIFGIFVIYKTGCFDIRSLEEFKNYLSDSGMIFFICAFFIGIAIYCWNLYINNVIIKPKRTTLYLLEKENHICKFIDKKGKIFYFEDHICCHKI